MSPFFYVLQLQMLGYDVSWAAFNIVEVMSSSKFTYKVLLEFEMEFLVKKISQKLSLSFSEWINDSAVCKSVCLEIIVEERLKY